MCETFWGECTCRATNSSRLKTRGLASKCATRAKGGITLLGMPRTPVYAWIEHTVRENKASERKSQGRIETWNRLAREIKKIVYNQELIFRRLDAYGERIRNIEQEVTIAVNAANSATEGIEGAAKARKLMEDKILDTFDYRDLIAEKINAIYRDLGNITLDD